jgi:hypothetical protein
MIKLGKREHMANLVEKGQLRFGTLKEYRGSELNQVGDHLKAVIPLSISKMQISKNSIKKVGNM